MTYPAIITMHLKSRVSGDIMVDQIIAPNTKVRSTDTVLSRTRQKACFSMF